MEAGRLPREIGLQVWMIVALALYGAMLLAAAGALVWVALAVPSGWLFVAAFVLATSAGAVALLGSATLPRAVPDERERVTRAVARLALVADVPSPACVVVANRALYVVLGPPAVVLMLVARIVSRHRELAADRAAALLVGSPAAVAAALAAVDDELARQRQRDLRRAHRRDAFHFVPACEARRLARLWATHPRTRRRIERMERLEAGLQR